MEEEILPSLLTSFSSTRSLMRHYYSARRGSPSTLHRLFNQEYGGGNNGFHRFHAFSPTLVVVRGNRDFYETTIGRRREGVLTILFSINTYFSLFVSFCVELISLVETQRQIKTDCSRMTRRLSECDKRVHFFYFDLLQKKKNWQVSQSQVHRCGVRRGGL